MKRPLIRFARAAAICFVSVGFAACSHQTHSTSPLNPIVESGPKVNPELGKMLLEDNAKVQRETWKRKHLKILKHRLLKNPLKVGNIL